VVREKGGYEGFNDRYVDLRVDDSNHPMVELRRIFEVYDMTMLSREDPMNLVQIKGTVAAAVQRDLKALRFYRGTITGVYDGAARSALRDFVNVNNFENRMHEDGLIWVSILNYMYSLTRRSQRRFLSLRRDVGERMHILHPAVISSA
jgi:uncharacterized Ntn-hydrolase superfamily protein